MADSETSQSAVPDVTVTVCTRNRARRLADMLDSLEKALKHSPVTTEAVFVDNGSSDGTGDVLQEWLSKTGQAGKVVVEPRPGLTKARNAALREMRGRAILFADDDVVLPEDWVATMAEPLLSGEADVIGAAVVLAPEIVKPWMSDLTRSRLAESTKFARGQFVVGASMGMSAHVFEKLRFDENVGPGGLGGAEDLFFSWQARQAGFRLAWLEEPEVVHRPDADRLTIPSLGGLAMGQGRGEAHVYYHWHHTRPRYPKLARLAAELSWIYHRATVKEQPDSVDRYLKAAATLGIRRQLAVEAGRPRRYERLGLLPVDQNEPALR